VSTSEIDQEHTQAASFADFLGFEMVNKTLFSFRPWASFKRLWNRIALLLFLFIDDSYCIHLCIENIALAPFASSIL
jgi:hypothetical protein